MCEEFHSADKPSMSRQLPAISGSRRLAGNGAAPVCLRHKIKYRLVLADGESRPLAIRK
jgi:hypothetical protein